MDTIALWEEELAVKEEARIFNFYGEPINEATNIKEKIIERIKNIITFIKEKFTNFCKIIKEKFVQLSLKFKKSEISADHPVTLRLLKLDKIKEIEDFIQSSTKDIKSELENFIKDPKTNKDLHNKVQNYYDQLIRLSLHSSQNLTYNKYRDEDDKTDEIYGVNKTFTSESELVKYCNDIADSIENITKLSFELLDVCKELNRIQWDLYDKDFREEGIQYGKGQANDIAMSATSILNWINRSMDENKTVLAYCKKSYKDLVKAINDLTDKDTPDIRDVKESSIYNF